MELYQNFYRPQTKFAKVMFLHVSVILSRGRVVSQHTLQVVSQHALQVSRPIPRRKLRGLAWGGGLQAHTQGKLRGLARVVSRPTLSGGSPGPHLGESPGPLLGVSRPTPRGVSRPTPRGSLQTHTWGYPRMH